MRFNEVDQKSEDDEYGRWDIDDTRRPKLTLRHLNKMRRARSVAEVSHSKKREVWSDMYAQNKGE